VNGESGDVNEENVHHWIKESLPEMILGYEPRHIFNKVETALFYSLMPGKTFKLKGETCAGGSKS
jgi:hypothetical protein